MVSNRIPSYRVIHGFRCFIYVPAHDNNSEHIVELEYSKCDYGDGLEVEDVERAFLHHWKYNKVKEIKFDRDWYDLNWYHEEYLGE